MHPIFEKYPPWSGVVPAGCWGTFYGSFVRSEFTGHAGGPEHHQGQILPPLNEELFEWIDLLQAVDDAEGSFVMAELGAGYGRWAVAGAAVAERFRPELTTLLIAVEAEPDHFQMLLTHLADNGLDPAEHRLIKAAVGEADGTANFLTGHAAKWWGQSATNNPDWTHGHWPAARIVPTPQVSIATALEGVERVDLIDMDIQGAEAEAVRGSLDVLTSKAKRLHIGTHGHDIEDELRRLLSGAGWELLRDYPCLTEGVETEYGPVDFQDGVQSWVNPRL